MIGILKVLFIATIVTRTDVGTFFTPIVTSNNLSSGSIAGATSNATLRITPEVASGHLSTCDAILQRMIWPALTDYGGARTARNLDDITGNADFFESATVSNKSITCDLVNYYIRQAGNISNHMNRNVFTAPSTGRCGRMGQIDDWFDGLVSDGDDAEPFPIPPIVLFNWILPGHSDANHVTSPNTWKSDLYSTFEFQKYLVTIGECVSDLNPPVWRSAFSQNLMFKNRDVLDLNIVQNGPQDISTRVTTTNDVPPISVFMNRVCPFIDFTSITNRPCRRFWYERSAFVNSLLSLMDTTLYTGDNGYPSLEGDIINSWGDPSYIPKHVLSVETHGSMQSIYATLKSKLVTETPGRDGHILIAVDPDTLSFDEYGESFTDLQVTTCKTTIASAAWRSIGYSDSIVTASFLLQPQDFGSMDKSFIPTNWVPVEVVETRTYDDSPRYLCFGVNGYTFTSVGMPQREEWDVRINIRATATAKGIFPKDEQTVVGPTIYETGVRPSGDISTDFNKMIELSQNFTTDGFSPCRLISQFIDSKEFRSFDGMLLTTNLSIIESAADGITPEYFNYGSFGDPKRDSWAVFRTSLNVPRFGIYNRAESEIIVGYDRLCPDKEKFHPPLQSSMNSQGKVSREDVKIMATCFHDITGSQYYVLDPQNLFVKLSSDGTVQFGRFIDFGNIEPINKDIFRWIIQWADYSHEIKPKMSPLVQFKREPHLLIHWKFPAMSRKDK